MVDFDQLDFYPPLPLCYETVIFGSDEAERYRSFSNGTHAFLYTFESHMTQNGGFIITRFTKSEYTVGHGKND